MFAVAIVIAGPVAPHTHVGLEAILSRHLELLEHGLCIVAEGVELGEVASITVLARDARGAPTLIFADDRAAHVPAAVCAARAHAHLVANPWLLQRLFPHRLPDAIGACLRVIVVALHFDALALATLRTVALSDLVAMELHEWSIGGRHEWCARPVWARPIRDDGGFSAPSGAPATVTEVVREFLSWLERLDADVTVEGDRYARHVRARGRSLCRVVVDARTAEAVLAGDSRLPLTTRDEAIAAMDRVMAAFESTLREAMAPAPVAPAGDADSLQLADLRRSVADVRVTRAECVALQFGDSES